MPLPPRISAVTFACRDLGRMSAFYRQFGWPEAPTSVHEHVVFQCANGVVLGLFEERVFDRFGEIAGGFRGVTISMNVEGEDAVVALHRIVSELDDVSHVEPLQRSGWGCGFSFSDPEGNVWDVAWKAGSEIDSRGGFRYP